MYLKVFAIFIKSYLDVAAFMHRLLLHRIHTLHLICGLNCICLWAFETLLRWLKSQMHFFNQEWSVANQTAPSISANHVSVDWYQSLMWSNSAVGSANPYICGFLLNSFKTRNICVCIRNEFLIISTFINNNYFCVHWKIFLWRESFTCKGEIWMLLFASINAETDLTPYIASTHSVIHTSVSHSCKSNFLHQVKHSDMLV